MRRHFLILSVFFFSMVFSLCLKAEVEVNVEISGLNPEMEKNARLFLRLEQQKGHSALTEIRLQRLHELAPQDISAALRPYGYYQPKIYSSLTHENNRWTAHYKVELGPPVHLKDSRIVWVNADNIHPDLLLSLRNFPLKDGDVLNHTLYESGKENILNTAQKLGYFEGYFVAHALKIDTENNSAQMILEFDPGPRFSFGPIIFNQNAYHEKYLNRFLPFQPGDAYSFDKVVELQYRLTDSDNFKHVEIQNRPDLSANYAMPLELNLSPQAKHTYQLGAGYGTDTGPRGTARWLNRRLNKNGHRVGIEANISEFNQKLATHMDIPLKKPYSDKLQGILGYTREETSNTLSETEEIALIHTFAAWQRRLFHSTSVQFLQGPFEIAKRDKYSTMLILGLRLSTVFSDNPINPTKGIRLTGELKGAHPDLLGTSTRFEQIRLQGKSTYAFGRSEILLRGDVGFTSSADFDKLRPELRFFTGGDNSVRGYDYLSLSPSRSFAYYEYQNANNTLSPPPCIREDDPVPSGYLRTPRTDSCKPIETFRVGGHRLLVGSIEYRYWLMPTWGVTAFFDAGNAINQWSEALKKGAGFGLLWKSPVGAFSISVASGLDKENKNSPRLHISIGPNL